MSGSPVYIGNKLLGALSYRIGQFSKEPIAGITPIEQMLEVRDILWRSATAGVEDQHPGEVWLRAGNNRRASAAPEMNFQAMETPLVMSGFRPEAIELWQKQMAGTGLARWLPVGWRAASSENARAADQDSPDAEPSAAAIAAMEPGSAVSAQLVRGDLEISATCTVTYIDPKQLLACGHPDSASGAGFVADDDCRCAGHAGIAAECVQDHQYRRDIGAFTRIAMRRSAAFWAAQRAHDPRARCDRCARGQAKL